MMEERGSLLGTSLLLLSSEVIVHDALGLYTEGVEHGDYCLRHRTGTAHVVLDVLGSLVVLQVGFEHDLMDEARGVFHAG